MGLYIIPPVSAPVQKILHIKFSSNFLSQISSEFAQALFTVHPLPSFSNSDSIELQKDIEDAYNKGITIGSRFNFPFCPDVLSRILLSDPFPKHDMMFISAFILYSYISWLFSINGEIDVNNASIMLHSLCLVLKEAHSSIAIDSYKFAFYILNKKGVLDCIPDILSSFSAFFLCDSTLLPEMISMFPAIIDAFVEKSDYILCHTSISVLKLLHGLISDKRDHQITSQIAQDIVDILRKCIDNLDLNAASYSSMFIKFLLPLNGKELTKQIGNCICNYICKSKWSLNVSIPQTQAFRYSISAPNYNNVFVSVTDQTFFGGFDLNRFDKLPEIDPNFVLSEIEICRSVSFIANELFNDLNITLTFFFTMASKMYDIENLNKSVEIYCALLVACQQFKKLPEITDILLWPQIFNATIICKQNDPSSFKINNIRSVAFDMMMLIGPSALDIILHTSIPFPKLFGEFILRCLRKPGIIINFVVQNNSLIQIFTECSIYLREFRIKGHSEVDSISIVLFRMISVLIGITSVGDIFFQSEYCVKALLSFLSEQCLTSFILGLIKSYVLSTDDKFFNTLSKGFISFIQYAYNNLPIRIIICINRFFLELFTIDPSSLESFNDLVFYLYGSFGMISINEAHNDYIISVIQLFSFVSQKVPISESVFTDLGNFIIHNMEKLSNNMVMEEIYHMCLSNVKLEETSIVCLNHPHGLFLYFQLSLRNGNFSIISHTINLLCSSSSKNCKILHHFGFDSYIIDVIIENWNDTSFTQFIMRQLIMAFFKISTVVTSVNTLNKFFSLFNQDNKGRFYENISIVFESLQESLYENRHNRVLYSPINHDSKIHVSIDLQENKGFTVLSFIFIPKCNPNYLPVFFSIQDVHNHSFFMFLSDGSLQIVNDLKNPTYNHIIKNDFIVEAWNFLSLSYMNNELAPQLQITLNEQIVSGVLLPSNCLLKGKVSVIFGGTLYPVPDSFSGSYFGPISVVPFLAPNQILSVLHSSKRQLIGISKGSFFLMRTFNPLSQFSSFLSVFVLKARPSISYPILLILNQFVNDKPKYLHLISYFYEFFCGLLRLGEDSVMMIKQEKTFYLLRGVLMKLDKRCITFDLYLMFFNLLEVMIQNDLQKDLIDAILMNIDIWINDIGDCYLKVPEHWNNELLPKYFHQVGSTISFSSFLNKCIFFSPPSIPEKHELSRFRPYFNEPINPNQELELREIICSILSQLSSYSFDYNDFSLITSYIMTSNNHQIVSFQVMLLHRLLNLDPCPLLSLRFESENVLASFHFMVNKHNGDIATKCIDLLISFFTKNIVSKPPLFDYINILMGQIPQLNLNLEFFNHILDLLVSGWIDLFFLACYISYSIGTNAILHLFQKICPKPDFAKQTYWAIWPLILYTGSDKYSRNRIIKFLVICNPLQWIQVYAAIEIVSETFHYSENTLKQHFLSEIANFIGKNQVSDEVFRVFCSITKEFLFYQDSDSISSHIISVFNTSPYSSGVPDLSAFSFRNAESAPHPRSHRSSNAADSLISIIQKYKYRQIDKVFRLRLDSFGKWCDRTLGMNILKVLISHLTDIDYYSYFLFLSSFLLHDLSDEVYNHIKNISIPNSYKSKLQPFLDHLSFLLNKMILPSMINIDVPSLSTDYLTQLIPLFSCLFPISVSDNIIRIINEIERLSYSSHQLSIEIYKSVAGQKIELWRESLTSVVFNDLISKQESVCSWRRLWSIQTLSGSAWNSNQHLYHRSSTICSQYYPSIVRKNKDSKLRIRCSEKKEFNSTRICATGHYPTEIMIHNRSIIISSLGKSEHRIPLVSIMSLDIMQKLYDPPRLAFQTKHGRRFLLRFPTIIEYSNFLTSLGNEYLPPSFHILPTLDNNYTKEWQLSNLTNFKYLLIINYLSGRCFEDTSSYPIMPLVVKDWESKSLDIENPNFFRDFTKPCYTNQLCNDKNPSFFLSNNELIRSYLSLLLPYGSLQPKGSSFNSIKHLFSCYSLNSNFFELIPEFFFSPEFLSNKSINIELPNWASNQFEFIYNHRKALESDYVTKMLPAWIDQVFGVNQFFDPNNSPSDSECGYFYPPTLFTKPHPNKTCFIPSKCADLIYLSTQTNVLYATQFLDEKQLSISFIDSQMSIYIITLVFEPYTKTFAQTHVETQSPTSLNESHQFIQSFYQISPNLFLLRGKSCFLYDSNTRTTTMFEKPHCFAARNGTFIVLNQENCLCMYTNPNLKKPDIVCHFPRDPGSVIAISNSFRFIIVSSIDSILWCSINTLECYHSVVLGQVSIENILITPSWGFVYVLYKKGKLFYHRLFTNNGDSISEKEICFPIGQVCSFASRSGFDYIALSDNEGNLYIFEAFYMNVGSIRYSYDIPISSIQYFIQMRSFVIVLENGDIHSLFFDI